MTTVSPAPVDAEREAAARIRLIAGLREMADWLEANPAVPVGEYPTGGASYPVTSYVADERAFGELDRIARLDDFKRQELRAAATGEIHYRLAKSFGPVTYTAFAILPDPAVQA